MKVSFVSEEVAFFIEQDTVNDGETLKVHITRNNVTEKGWIGTFPKNEGTGEWDVYENVTPSTKVVFLEIKTYGRPGRWQLRFFRDSSHDNMCGFLDFTVIGETKNPIVMSIDKEKYKTGGVVAVNITSTEPFPDSAWIGLFPATCPSRWYSSIMWSYVREGGLIQLNIEDNHNHGPYELRYFPSAKFQPLLHVPFFVESERHVKLTCTPRVLDGRTITIKWDPSLYPLQMFGKYNDKNEPIRPWIKLFPKNQLSTFVLEDRHYLEEGKNTVQIYADSGIQPSGDWQVRLFMDEGPTPHVVCDFLLVGVFEMFFEKMSKNTHHDVLIFCEE